MIRRLAFALLAASSGSMAVSRADPPMISAKVSPRTDNLDLLVLAGDKPVRLELRIEIDRKSVPEVWDETFTLLIAFHDRNGDGTLDKDEATRLPSVLDLRKVLWGHFTLSTDPAPPFTDLDLNADGKVSTDELADFYRRAGLGGVVVGVGRPAATDQLTHALLKHLDVNKDGRVSEAEWKSAVEVLRKLDGTDDELIGPGELVEKLAYPGASGSSLLAAPHPGTKPDPVSDALPFMTLPLRTADTYWIPAVIDRRRKEHAAPLSIDDLKSLRMEPAVTWQVRLGARSEVLVPLASNGIRSPLDSRLRYESAGVRLDLRADDGKLAEQASAAIERFLSLFTEVDANSDGSLDAKELGTPKAVQFKHLLAAADRNNDEKLSKDELTARLNLQKQIAKGHVLLTVLDHGRGLFELLDTDHDGSLSVRELRTAWDRLKAAGCVAEGIIDLARVPRQLLAAVSRGHPQTALGRPARSGPEWFRAMDRNGDGDVSRKEFTGPATVFDTLDLDGDGLLSAEEAEKAVVKW